MNPFSDTLSFLERFANRCPAN